MTIEEQAQDRKRALLATREELKAKIVEINKEVKAIDALECLRLHKVKVGSVIRAGGDEWKLTQVEPSGYGFPNCYGVKRKKNEEWGTRDFYIRSHWNDNKNNIVILKT